MLLDRGRVILAGEADTLRETGWSGQQEVVFRGNDLAFTNALGAMAHLDEIGPDVVEGTRRAHIRLREGQQPAALLGALAPAVEVLEFIKVRPTMESLFIEAVEGAAAATPTAP